MAATLRRHWFLVALAVLIPGGLLIGFRSESAAGAVADLVQPRWITAAALFLMSFTLDSSQLSRSLKAPGPVLLASVVNLGLLPLAALLLSLAQLLPDFRYGLIVAAAAPCTMAAASVWTRQAGGNDAVSLLVTLLTNSVCVVVTPFWIRLGTGADTDLGFGDMAIRLLAAVLIPGCLGQTLRMHRRAREFAVAQKKRISVAAMVCILLLVASSSLNCGAQLAGGGTPPSAVAIGFVWVCCVGLHLGAMSFAVFVARLTGVTDFDRPAVAFASSQKTLPIGVMMAHEISAAAGVPFAVFPMLMFHASQLLIDTPIANRMARARETDAASTTDQSGRTESVSG